MKFSSTHWFIQQIKPFLLLFVLFTGNWTLNHVSAQTTCEYTVEMSDFGGNGWTGNVLTVISNGVTTTHSLANGAFGLSTFEVANGAPVVLKWEQGLFPEQPGFDIVNPDGFVVFSATGTIPEGELYNESGFCPVCEFPDIIVTNQITDTSGRVNWLDVPGALSYLIEYGPQGFPRGEGLTQEVTDSEITLMGLNPCIDYDVYLTVHCGMDSLGTTQGPIQFQTDYILPAPGNMCTYTIELFDLVGDGWTGGSTLTLTQDGMDFDYTLTDGTEAVFEFEAIANVPVDVSYSAGFFEGDVSYNIVDPNGLVIFSDGPFPLTGDVFSFIACPDCPAPLDVTLSDVNADNARLSWTPYPGANGDLVVEWGPIGFTLGTGSSVTLPATQSFAQLTGLAENTWYNAYIRLDCDTIFSKPIGPFMFQTLWRNDVGVTAITEPDPEETCDYADAQTISVDLTNFGQAPQTLFEFYYAVNGVPASIPVPQDGLFTGVVGNDSTQNISFETTWDFSEPGVYVIEAWTVMVQEDDRDLSNDTSRLEIVTAIPKPLFEDFEEYSFPKTWSFEGNTPSIYPPGHHGNDSYVFGTQQAFFSIPTTLTTSRVGRIEAGDSLFFDYRFVAPFPPYSETPILSGDFLEIQLSTDCGENYETVFTIDETNHIPTTDLTTIGISLDDYDGELINIRFIVQSFINEFWLDLDNINIPGCSGNLGLVGNIAGSAPNGATGSITVTPFFGVPPYTYSWNTGGTGNSISGLSSGVYEVVVTDATGCSDSRTFDVGIFVSSDKEIVFSPEIKLYPNPTSALATLDLVFPAATDYQVRALNLSGQLVFEAERQGALQTREELDFSDQPPGMYILQIIADGKPYYAKLIVSK